MRPIDADGLKEIIEYQQTINPKLSVYDVIKVIDNAPTVIKDNRPNICFNCEHCCALTVNSDGEVKVMCNLGAENCDNQRPTGEWIEGYHDSFETLDCSVCGYVRNERYSQLKYCPNCGAQMKGEEE